MWRIMAVEGVWNLRSDLPLLTLQLYECPFEHSIHPKANEMRGQRGFDHYLEGHEAVSTARELSGPCSLVHDNDVD